MQSNISNIFNEPAIKLFCSQLKKCKIQGSSEQCLIPLRSSITGREIRYPVQLAWFQGNIHQVVNNSEVLLQDVSGDVIKVVDCDKMVGGSGWIKQGLYCSVIGSIGLQGQSLVIQALKMNMLDNSSNLKILWDWEVKDLANELCDNSI